MAITAGLAQGAYQAAIYTRLTTDASMVALATGGIYDAVPATSLNNYVAIGDWTEESDDTLENDNAGVGSDMTISLHFYTDDAMGAAGYAKVQAMASRAKVLLHGYPITATGWATVTLEHEETVVLRDFDLQDRPKRHGISTYRVMAEAT